MNLAALFTPEISLWTAFGAGILSFLSPCILPLIPAWLTLITGLSLDALTAADKKRFGFLQLLPPTILFVLGLGSFFCLLGAAAGFFGEALQNYRSAVRVLAGIFLVFFGLYLTGIIKPLWLMKEKRVELHRRPIGLIGSFLVGIGFAAGWTPCVGPVLASILAIAALEESATEGLRLLAVYSAGLGVPFILMTLGWGAAAGFLRGLVPFAKRLTQVMGILLLIIGILTIFGKLSFAV